MFLFGVIAFSMHSPLLYNPGGLRKKKRNEQIDVCGRPCPTRRGDRRRIGRDDWEIGGQPRFNSLRRPPSAAFGRVRGFHFAR
ncbi:hypothetical protein EVAR_79632_1 [Eumeta japonica]|uniref:Uncharacterized protein n=1 Tax=Eumeta variegata TaxID=151549 RepID=A0A4C1UEB5_EUMVA|nr:hypothetical protein EVAR_79632_1 [Eumeta japonica]